MFNFKIANKFIANSGAFILTLCVLLSFLNCNRRSSNSTDNNQNVYQEKVMSVKQIEDSNPVKFLSANCEVHGNFWGDKMTFDGYIINNATVANYKDVIVKIVFCSATETELTSQNYTIYNYFNAHTKQSFRFKLTKYANCSKYKIFVVGATPY